MPNDFNLCRVDASPHSSTPANLPVWTCGRNIAPHTSKTPLFYWVWTCGQCVPLKGESVARHTRPHTLLPWGSPDLKQIFQGGAA